VKYAIVGIIGRHQIPFVLRLFIIQFLCLLTLAHAVFIDEYIPGAHNLLLNPKFENDLNGWQFSKRLAAKNQIDVEDGYLHLSASNKIVTISQEIQSPIGYQFIQVSVNASINHVIKGDKGWEKYITGNIEVVEIPAEHNNFLEHPLLAKELSKHLIIKQGEQVHNK